MDPSEDDRIRLACLDWLNGLAEASPGEDLLFSFQELLWGFPLGGDRVSLASPKGIHKPRGMRWPLTIRSIAPGSPDRPYKDSVDEEDRLLYRYRGTDPGHPDNVGLVEAMAKQIPLVYLQGVGNGLYMAVWPVFVVESRPDVLTFVIVADGGKGILRRGYGMGRAIGDNPEIQVERRYATRLALARIHQQTFRQRVLRAYRSQCAVCRLKHGELLDAAHIVPDAGKKGVPLVRNGLSLCKIHHAAFDRNLLGISPDYIVQVREDVLEEENGPMLLHGFKEMHGRKIFVPGKEAWRPDRERLAERFEGFRKAM